MADLKASIRRHKRQKNMCNDDNRASLKLPEKSVGPYEIEKFLKEGSSSKIFLAKSKYTGENVIIKVLSKSRLKDNLDDLLLITKQMETLKILKHRNIISLYEIYESPKNFYFITEHLSGKDLIEKLIKKKRFTEEEALRIFFQLLDAMTYMHKMNICHRNIRTEHILFDKNNRPKIIGFGYSTFYEKNKKIQGSYGSLCYACPEIIDDSPYNPELADVWSLGVILYVLICGYLPFSDDDDNKNKILIQNAKIDFPKEISNKLKDLIRHMLDKNPAKRYTFQKIAKHPWIKPYSESLFSGGINIHKNIFPVDERLLNIVNQYGFDKEKIKNDLIQNKFNIGTGVYKQIIRKLLDLKMKNKSDLYSEEFLEYKEDEKNEYKEGEKKYEDFIKKVDEKYKKIEDFINNFKEREDYVAEKLLSIQEKRESELAAVEEKKDIEEEDNDQDEEKDIINEMEKNEKNKNNNDSIRRVKSHNIKTFNRNKTVNYNFRELIQGKRGEIINKNLLGDNINPDNIEIVYNKEEEVDIIQQFQDEQNKKLSENLNLNMKTEDDENNENLFLRKNSSTPNLLQDKDSNSNVANIKKSLKLSVTPKKNENEDLAKKLLNKSGIVIELKEKKNSSNINDINISSLLNNYKSIRSGNVNEMNMGFLRMTSTRKSKKNYLDRGSFLDSYLKKNHPDNIRKTMLKENNIYDSHIDEIKEGIKENDESESEDNNKNNDEEEEKEKESGVKTSKDLKFSLNFDDDDEDEDDNENGENDITSNYRYSLGDSKLFKMLENGENDEELKELKRIYFNEDDKEEKEEKKEKENKKKEKEENKDKDKKDIKKEEEHKDIKKDNKNNSKDKDLNKSNKTKKKVSFNIDNEYSNLKISFHDEVDGKFRCNLYEVYNNYINDTEPISKLDFFDNQMPFNLSDIHNKYKNKYFYTITTEDKPIKKIKINNKNDNNISDINKYYIKNNKNNLNKNNKKGIDKNNNQEKEKIKEIPFQEGKKKLINNSSNNSKKKYIVNEKIKNISNIIKKDIGTQTRNNEDDILRIKYYQEMKKQNDIRNMLKYLKKSNQEHFCIKGKYKRPNLNYLNERNYNDYNEENSSDYYYDELNYSKNSTYNPDLNYKNEIIYGNNNYPGRNFFYSNISYDKRKKLILPKKPKIVPRNKITKDKNNNFISTYTDKRIKNYIHKPYIKNHNLDSSNEKEKSKEKKIPINKNQKINNYYSNIPKRSDFYINNNFNMTSKFNINYDNIKEKFNLDELSLTNKKNTFDTSKEIKNEYLITKKDLIENMNKCDKILNTYNDYTNNNLMNYLKNDYKTNNNDKFGKINNLSSSYVPNEPNYKYISSNEKISTNNNDINFVKIKYLFDDNNYMENDNINNKIETKFINKEKQIPYKKINIGSKEKSKDKNYVSDQTNNIKEKEKWKKNYHINSLPQNYLNLNRRSEILGNNYSSNTENPISNNIKYNKNSYNQNKNFNFGNYNIEERKPLYNKKKMGLYKNYDEFNYLSNNIPKIKEKPIVNIPLKKYMNKIDDNIFDYSNNKSFD